MTGRDGVDTGRDGAAGAGLSAGARLREAARERGRALRRWLPGAAGAAEAGGRSYRTTDTARPEGGRRTASGSHAAPMRQWPLLAVLCVVLVGLLVTLGNFRVGLLIVGVAMLGGAVLRGWLPAVGMLAVRSRFTDVLTYGLLGSAIVLLTLMAEPSPWLEIPLLNDVLRFSAG